MSDSTNASSTTRYRREEYQDNEGNVIYPHTDAAVVWLPDGTSLDTFLSKNATDEEITAALID